MSNVPHYPTVPEHWKHPFGPYRQAPEEYGGEWWFINPFTSPNGVMPWANEEPEPQTLPDGFELLFGPRPEIDDFGPVNDGGAAYRQALNIWQQHLSTFKQVGTPPWADEGKMAAAAQTYEAWKLGKPVFYEGRYGWLARFPESRVPRKDFSAYNAVELPQLTVAAYQMAVLAAGGEVAEPHPFVPPQLFASDDEESE